VVGSAGTRRSAFRVRPRASFPVHRTGAGQTPALRQSAVRDSFILWLISGTPSSPRSRRVANRGIRHFWRYFLDPWLPPRGLLAFARPPVTVGLDRLVRSRPRHLCLIVCPKLPKKTGSGCEAVTIFACARAIIETAARASGESLVSTREPHFYDAETISMLKSAFDETCAAVPADRLTQAMRASIAEHILKIARTGERDRVRLRTRALMEVASNKRD
jgi:hypothetical protein